MESMYNSSSFLLRSADPKEKDKKRNIIYKINIGRPKKDINAVSWYRLCAFPDLSYLKRIGEGGEKRRAARRSLKMWKMKKKKMPSAS